MLIIKNLRVIHSKKFEIKPINLHLQKGEILTIIGESGSGKTTLGKVISRSIEDESKVKGNVYINGEDIYKKSEVELLNFRRKEVTICFQNSRDILNPRLDIKEHIFEVFDGPVYKVLNWLNKVGLDEDVLNKFPKELSGGERQKILIILALINKPKVVVLDEPTSSLDIKSKKLLFNLIKEENKLNNITFIIITHDLSLVKNLNSFSMVLYDGHVLEIANNQELLKDPKHPWSRALINSSIDINPFKDIWGVNAGKRNRKGCPFYYRCTQSIDECKNYNYDLKEIEKNRYISCNRGGITSLISAKNINKSYNKNIILKNINLNLYSGEIVSIVGPSGIGKTTLLEIIGGFRNMDSGDITIKNKSIVDKLYQSENGMQFIFQDPKLALNLDWTVLEIISEPLKIQNYEKNTIRSLVYEAMEKVGLKIEDGFLNLKVNYISDGEKQRVIMARALVMKPSILLADEPVSMLDPSNKASLLNFLKEMQNKEGFSMLMITHDLNAAIKVSDRIYLMNKEGFFEYRGFEIEELINVY